MTAYQRNKGKRGELEVVRLLKVAGYEAKRLFQFRGGAQDEQPDVSAPPFAVEVKTGPSYRYAWADKVIRQARGAAGAAWAVAWIRPGRGGEKYVMIPESDWLEILAQVKAGGVW